MEETATAIALPDDAVREILARVVDPADLFRCSTACKWWRVLIADLFFLRRRWPADSPKSSSVYGFFALERDGRMPVFIPAPQSPLGIGRRSLSSFFFPEAASFLDHVAPLTARRGLLLVHLRRRRDAIHLAVCDPLAGTCNVLPPLKCNSDIGTSCFAIVTGADVCSRGQSPLPGYSTFFKVLFIADVLSKDSNGLTWNSYDLHMFTSNESSWTVPRKCFNRLGHVNPTRQRSGVVRRGTAHWLFHWSSNYYILQVSAHTAHVSFTKLSIPLYTFDIAPWLSIDINRALSLLRLTHHGDQVENWTSKDGDTTSPWICTRTLELEISKQDRARSPCLCVGERSGELLFVRSGIHIAELQNGATKDVSAQFSSIDYLASHYRNPRLCRVGH
jgi:hypothetical protein